MIQERVISTVALVLEQFITKVRSEIQNVNLVYDEKLSYETAITKFRSDNDIDNSASSDTALPLFAFRRSVLRYADKGIGKRSPAGSNLGQILGNKRDVFKVAHAEMDIDFLFIVKSASDSELFEIEYLSETGLSKQKELLVDVRQDLGVELPYFVEYQPLTEKVMESDTNFFKAISGSAKVTGYYPVFKTTSNIILSIGGIYGIGGPGIGSGIGSGANIYDNTKIDIPTEETILGNISVSIK